MAVDRAQLTANLHSFYDFERKIVLCVGAGHGQLLDPSIMTTETVLIDGDKQSLGGVSKEALTNEKRGRMRTVLADFKDVNMPGDVVYFEFCLHEMDSPRQEIEHARTLATEVVIFDHSPSSEWIFYAAEEEGVCRCAQALAQFPVKRRQHVFAQQTFKDHDDLVAKLAKQGSLAIDRADRFTGKTNIVIPMKCILALL